MLELTTLVTSQVIQAIKADLQNLFPTVKSSHRVEALARGLNFKTYASLRSAAASPSECVATPNGKHFSAYLAKQGFKISTVDFHRAIARAALRAALEKAPRLSMWGIGIGPYKRKDDGKWENAYEHHARFLASRAEFLSKHGVDEFLRAVSFLRLAQPTKTIRPGTGSYWLKHIAENHECSFPEGEKLGPHYVSNGALIAAAIHLGFKYKVHWNADGWESVSVSFNMNVSVLNDLDCRFRPDGAKAQARQRKEEEKRRKEQIKEFARSYRIKLREYAANASINHPD